MFYIFIGILLIGAGVWLFFSTAKKDKAQAMDAVKKDGLPLSPRHTRQKPAIINDGGDALSHLAVVATAHTEPTGTTTFNANPATQPFAGFGSVPPQSAPKPEQSTAFGSFTSEPPTANQVNTEQATASFANFNQPNSEPQATQPPPTQPIFDSSSLAMDDENVAIYDETRIKPDRLQQFDGEPSALDEHFHKQENEHSNQKEMLENRENNITLLVRPKNNRVIGGNDILRLAQDYAMKYNALKMFHRYENAEGTGELWFSMLGFDENGITDFDLVAISGQFFYGIVLFLSLPHSQALRGFDSMVSVAQAMADELDAEIYNDNNELMDTAKLQAARSLAMNYA